MTINFKKVEVTKVNLKSLYINTNNVELSVEPYTDDRDKVVPGEIFIVMEQLTDDGKGQALYIASRLGRGEVEALRDALDLVLS